MAHNALELSNLTQRFQDHIVVDGLTLSIEQGEVFGFLGHNGAGKTTTIQMLTTLAKPVSGTAEVAGFDLIKTRWGSAAILDICLKTCDSMTILAPTKP